MSDPNKRNDDPIYRDKLASDLKKIRQVGPLGREAARKVIGDVKETQEYIEAKVKHVEGRKDRKLERLEKENDRLKKENSALLKLVGEQKGLFASLFQISTRLNEMADDDYIRTREAALDTSSTEIFPIAPDGLKETEPVSKLDPYEILLDELGNQVSNMTDMSFDDMEGVIINTGHPIYSLGELTGPELEKYFFLWNSSLKKTTLVLPNSTLVIVHIPKQNGAYRIFQVLPEDTAKFSNEAMVPFDYIEFKRRLKKRAEK